MPVVRDPKQILDVDDPPFLNTFRNPWHSVQEAVVTQKAALESDDEASPSRLTPASDVPLTLPELFYLPLLRASTSQTVRGEVRRIHVFKMNKSFIEAEEDAFSSVFQIGYSEANDGFKNALLYFVEMILTKIAKRGALDDLLERNLEKLTKSPMFIDVLQTCAIPSSRFICQVAKFIRAKIERKTHLDDKIGMKPESLSPPTTTSFSVAGSSIDIELRKLATEKTKKIDKPRDHKRKSREKHKKSP